MPTVNQFPTIDLHRKGAVFRSTPSRLTGAGATASPVATSASPTLKHSASFPTSLDNVHALDLGGVTGVGGGVPRYPTVPPPATPALSVLSAQDDDLLGGDRAEISLSGGASGVAVLRQAVRRKGRWRAVFKALRRADPSGSERVPMRDFMSAMSAAGVLAAVAKALESPDRDSDTLSDARRLITAVAARFPGASASKPGSSARSRGTSRSRARSPIVRPVYGDDATVAYVRFLRKLVPAAGPGQVFSPSRPVPQHLAHERPHTASGHLPYGFGTGRSAASGRSVDTGTFARQGDNNDGAWRCGSRRRWGYECSARVSLAHSLGLLCLRVLQHRPLPSRRSGMKSGARFVASLEGVSPIPGSAHDVRCPFPFHCTSGERCAPHWRPMTLSELVWFPQACSDAYVPLRWQCAVSV